MSMLTKEIQELVPHFESFGPSATPTNCLAVSCVTRPNVPFHLGRLLNLLTHLNPEITQNMLAVDCTLSHMCGPTVFYTFCCVSDAKTVFDVISEAGDMNVEYCKSPLSISRFVDLPRHGMDESQCLDYYSYYGLLLGATLKEGKVTVEFNDFRHAFQARVDSTFHGGNLPSVAPPPGLEAAAPGALGLAERMFQTIPNALQSGVMPPRGLSGLLSTSAGSSMDELNKHIDSPNSDDNADNRGPPTPPPPNVPPPVPPGFGGMPPSMSPSTMGPPPGLLPPPSFGFENAAPYSPDASTKKRNTGYPGSPLDRPQQRLSFKRGARSPPANHPMRAAGFHSQHDDQDQMHDKVMQDIETAAAVRMQNLQLEQQMQAQFRSPANGPMSANNVPRANTDDNWRSGPRGSNPTAKFRDDLEVRGHANSNENFGSRMSPTGRSRRSMKIETSEQNQFTIDMTKVEAGEDDRTTIMVQNIPSRMKVQDFSALIDVKFADQYDFVYLPRDINYGAALGYVFLNLRKVETVKAFYQEFNNKTWEGYANCHKHARISYARIQGVDQLMYHFKDKSVFRDALVCPRFLGGNKNRKIGKQGDFGAIGGTPSLAPNSNLLNSKKKDEKKASTSTTDSAENKEDNIASGKTETIKAN